MSVNSTEVARRRGIFAWLNQNISTGNAVTLLFCAWIAMTLMSFIAFLRPMLFEEVLLIPREQHGRITGMLLVVNDGIAFAAMLLFGKWSDTYGRRRLFSIGILILALAITLNPFAGDLTGLILVQFVIGVGFAGTSVMISSMLQDYPQEQYRGKFLGIASIAAGLGMLFLALVITRIPEMLTTRGYSPAAAISITFWVGAGLATLAAVVGYIGLNREVVAPTEQKPPLLKGLREALLAAKLNKKIRLGYAAGFASRGDLAMIGTLFPLWFMHVGKKAGMESAEVLATSGMMFGVITLAGFVAGPAIGFLSDKIRREVTVTIVFGLAALAYTLTGLVEDPFNMKVMLPVCLLLGLAEVGAIVACGTLVGQEAPKETRGTIIAWYQVFGGIGIAVCVLAGGYLFDRVAPTAPFLMMGVVNLIVMFLGWSTCRQVAATDV